MMELIIISSVHSANSNDILIQRLRQVGYVYLDPDQYAHQDLSETAFYFDDMLSAKQLCLQEAMNTMSRGLPVVLAGDFLGAKDLAEFHRLGCNIEYVDADTAPHTLVHTLKQKRDQGQSKVSEHWLGFKLFQSRRA